jgi:ABC-type iron transport system FetAB permease component
MNYIRDNFVGGLYLFFMTLYNISSAYPIGFLCVLISSIYLYRLRIKKSIIFGFIGDIVYGLTIIHFVIIYIISTELIILLLTLIWLIILIVNLIIHTRLRSKNKEFSIEDEMTIRQTILDLGTKFTRLDVREISEKCEYYNSDSIIKVLNSMISNKEIYAEFFKSSKTVSFDQQANIDEIDELMAVFKDWEDDQITKKELQEN